MLAPFPLEFYLNYKVSMHRNSRTFQHRPQFSRTFKALNFYFKIQRFLRTFKVCVNPVAHSQKTKNFIKNYYFGLHTGEK